MTSLETAKYLKRPEYQRTSAPPNMIRQIMAQTQTRSLGLVIMLFAIWIALNFLTEGLFLTPRNMTNLSGQVAITAILACGAVMLMVPGP